MYDVHHNNGQDLRATRSNLAALTAEYLIHAKAILYAITRNKW